MKVYTSKSIRELFEMKTSFENGFAFFENGFAFFMENKLKNRYLGWVFEIFGGKTDKKTDKKTKKRPNEIVCAF